MKRSLRFRAHEWLADRVSWIQYPGVQSVGQKRRPLWAYPMPIWQRAYMALVSLFALVVCGALLVIMLIVVYAFVSGFFA